MGRPWPSKTTAILIIHGIGDQHPFETLDDFTSTFWNVIEQLNGNKLFPGKHKIAQRHGWIQNYVSVGRTPTDRITIDFYEYYWAHKAERQANLADIVTWLIETSDGAQKFYEENKKLAGIYEGTNVDAFRKGKFKDRWYLKHLGWLMRLLSFVPISLSRWIARRLGPLLLFLNPLFRWIEKKMITYIGDIVVYTNTDIKSKFFSVRKQILDGAVEELETIVKDKQYGQIIVAGHSLGSVIAFDALNRINHAMNIGIVAPRLAKKIVGLVTFGSPLDKIAFFFREHTPDEQYLRRQILQHYHSFKARPLTEQPNPKELSNPFKRFLDHVHWMNFWDVEDKVSGHLDFYEVDENRELKMGKGSVKAHTQYWSWPDMYKLIVKKYLV